MHTEFPGGMFLQLEQHFSGQPQGGGEGWGHRGFRCKAVMEATLLVA